MNNGGPIGRKWQSDSYDMTSAIRAIGSPALPSDGLASPNFI